jgi:hypothetical protein
LTLLSTYLKVADELTVSCTSLLFVVTLIRAWMLIQYARTSAAAGNTQADAEVPLQEINHQETVNGRLQKPVAHAVEEMLSDSSSSSGT